jgi:uncharacterized protein (TIGR03000 family)
MLIFRKRNGIALVAASGIALLIVLPALAQPNVLPGPAGSSAGPELVPGWPVPPSEQIYTPPAGLRFLGGQGSSWSEFPLRSASPIFMTSLNYPGVYGAYYFGAAPPARVATLSASPYTLRPTWTTLPPAWATPPSAPLPMVKIEPAASITEVRGDAATIRVYTPEPASVWVQGQALPGNGTEKLFTTPALRPNQLYSYEVTAMWSQDGMPVKETRTTVIQSGERNVVSFHRKPIVNHSASPGTRVPD